MAMRARRCVVWRRGRKPVSPLESVPSDDLNAQYFQVGVTVVEARRLAWSSAHWRHCFVVVSLHNSRQKTMMRKNMAEPRFKEYLDFDLYMNEQSLQQLSLVVSFMELKCCAPPQILGETKIPLRDIWTQPGHHQQMWHQLISAKHPDLGPVGLISLDITIGNTHRGSCCALMMKSDKINPNPNTESQWANYMISVYQAFLLMRPNNKVDTKPPSTFIRVSFCNLNGKTDVQQRTFNPVYNEKISIVDIFPSPCTRVTFEVHAEGRFNILASSHLEFSQISHEGENGFLPTFGPSLLQLYSQSSCKCKKKNLQEGGPFYGGALLVALETVVPYNQQTKQIKRRAFVEPLEPLGLESVWQLEEFCLFCPLFEVSLLDQKAGGRDNGIAITMEEMPGFGDNCSHEFSDLKRSIKELRLHYTGPMAPTLIDERRGLAALYFANAFPVLQLAATLPDFRLRMYRNNLLLGIAEKLEITIASAEGLLSSEAKCVEILKLLNKAFDATAAMVLNAIDIMAHSKGADRDTRETVLDQKQVELQRQELQKTYIKIADHPRISCFGCGGTRIKKTHVTSMLVVLKEVSATLKKLIFRSPDGWPKIIVWLLESGSRVAFAKISSADILHSVLPEQCGRKCGKVQTVYLQSVKCGPPVMDHSNECLRLPAKVELMMWLAPHRQSSGFAGSVPSGYTFRLDRSRMFLETTARVLQCRVFIYKANLLGVSEDTFSVVRIYALGLVNETLAKENPNPIWDQTLRVQSGMYISVDKLQKYPPEVLIEVLSRSCKSTCKRDDLKSCLIGRVTVKSVVDLKLASPVAPKLQAYDIHNIYTEECRGQILVAAQTVEIHENLLSTTLYEPLERPSSIIETDPGEVATIDAKNRGPCEPCEAFCSVPSHATHEASSNTLKIKLNETATNVPSQAPLARGTSTTRSQAQDVSMNVPSYQRAAAPNVPTHQPRESSQNAREVSTFVRTRKPIEAKVDITPEPRELSTYIPYDTPHGASFSTPSYQPFLAPTRDITSTTPPNRPRLDSAINATCHCEMTSCKCKVSDNVPTHETRDASTSASSCQPCGLKPDFPLHQPQEPSNGTQGHTKSDVSSNNRSCRPCLASIIEPPCLNKPPCDPCPAAMRAPYSTKIMSPQQVSASFPTYQLHKTITDVPLYQPLKVTTDVQSSLEMSHETVDIIERIPSYLKPQIGSYKIDICWWGLRDVNYSIKKSRAVLEIDNLAIKSDIINNDTPNCNFSNNRIISQIIQTSFDKGFSANASFILYSSSSFGRTVFFGSKIVKNSRKFLIDWVPKNEREVSLKSAALIQSSDFMRGVVSSKINTLQSMQSYPQTPQSVNCYSHNTSNGSAAIEPFDKARPYLSNTKKWYHMFYNKDIEEEQLMLLPPANKENSESLFNEKEAMIYASVYNTAASERKTLAKSDLQAKPILSSANYDWWTRYLISEKAANKKQEINEGADVNSITIYNAELECQPQFSEFEDWCHAVKLYKSHKTGVPEVDRELVCGILKAGVAIYRWPPATHTVAVSHSGADLNKSYFEDHPANTPSKFLLRIYLVRGVDLMLNDAVGMPDSYAVIGCGKKRLGSRDNYVPKSGKPAFAKMYELNCTLPDDYLVTVYVYNREQCSTDTLIGQTTIDIENRIYSKHRAMVGLASEYKQSGPCKWRDYAQPSSILKEICCRNHIPPPSFPDDSTVIFSETAYRKVDVQASPAEEQRESICLSLLHRWRAQPVCGHALVPEHVETRTLYKPDQPGVEQGKLQMWVDIFPLPLNAKVPAPVDITAPRARDYELWVTVRALSGLRLRRGRDLPGTAADVYVTAWIGNQEEAQVTDVYNSVNGGGALPWLMMFPFKYQSYEKKILLEEKGVFTEISENKEPILQVKVVLCDGAPYTCLGTLAMNLHHLPKAVSSPPQGASKLAQGPQDPRSPQGPQGPHGLQGPQDPQDPQKGLEGSNLFVAGSARGWWPLVDDNLSHAGAIDLELNLSTKGKSSQGIRLGRMNTSENSRCTFSSEPSTSVSQEECLVNNSLSTILNQHSLRILICLLLIGSIYFFCSVSCFVLSN